MSQQHIPQPDTMAPGLEISSTGIQPANLVSDIETPPPNPQDIAAAMEWNMIDPYFYKQEIRIATLTWSKMDPLGKILWSVPGHPMHFSQQLAYLMGMYYAWNGSFEIGMRVIGTGFHLGQVTLVHVPPGIDPRDYQRPTEITVFPWTATDPKDLAVRSILMKDVRPIYYHIMRSDIEKDITATSGTVALYVDAQLGTSATGAGTIQIVLWARLAQDFRVSTVLPPRLDTPGTVFFPPQIITSFNLIGTGSFTASYPEVITQMLVLPNSIQIIDKLFNTYSFDGKPNAKFHTVNYPPILVDTINIEEVQTDQRRIKGTVGIPWSARADRVVIFWQEMAYQGFIVETSGERTTTFEFKSFPSGLTTGIALPFEYVYGQSNAFNTYADNSIAPPVKNESFVVFSSFDKKVYSIQPWDLSRLLATGEFDQAIPSGQAALLQVVEKASQLPILQLKLYPEGFLTTAGTTTQDSYGAESVEIKFLYFIDRFDRFVPNEQQALNRMTYQNKVKLDYIMSNVPQLMPSHSTR